MSSLQGVKITRLDSGAERDQREVRRGIDGMSERRLVSSWGLGNNKLMTTIKVRGSIPFLSNTNSMLTGLLTQMKKWLYRVLEVRINNRHQSVSQHSLLTVPRLRQAHTVRPSVCQASHLVVLYQVSMVHPTHTAVVAVVVFRCLWHPEERHYQARKTCYTLLDLLEKEEEVVDKEVVVEEAEEVEETGEVAKVAKVGRDDGATNVDDAVLSAEKSKRDGSLQGAVTKCTEMFRQQVRSCNHLPTSCSAKSCKGMMS